MALRACLSVVAAALLALLTFDVGVAQAPAPRPQATEEADAHAERQRLPADVTTKLSLTLNGAAVSVSATAGSLRLSDESGAPQADVAYMAYALDGADAAKRPVVFAVNGGPGASSAWLQLGAMGPWRLPMGGLSPSSTPALVDNAETWLDFADLVFLDPPGTGYSRVLGGENARKRLWSVEGDVDALSAAIRKWLVANGRLASPKFIVGESYGGFRAPRIAKRLASDEGVGVEGLVLVSPALEIGGFAGARGGPFPLLTRLPAYAAAEREKKGPVTRADLADVEAYATGEFLQDWLKGPRDKDAVDSLVKRVVALTGLDEATVKRLSGRVDAEAYQREAQRAEGKVVADYDATISAYDAFPEGGFGRSLDPILPGYEAAFTSAMVSLYREKFGWKIDDRYEVLNGAVNHAWDWGEGRSAPSSLGDLRQMLALDPKFRVLIVHGLTDLTTPYLATSLELAQFPDFGGSDRVTLKVYGGGHMLYSRDESRRALHDDAKRLIGGS